MIGYERVRRAVIASCIPGLVLMSFAAWSSEAQERSAWEESGEAVERMMGETGAFIAATTFTEADVLKLIELWADFEAASSRAQEDERGEAREEEMIDFRAVIADPGYRRWAASHALDPEDWLRKATRIGMLLYRDQMAASMATAPAQFEQQMAMLERQRDQIGEEMYQEMRRTMQVAVEASRRSQEAILALPEPTSAERALLAKYRDQLLALEESDDGDEGYEEYDYEEDHHQHDE